jgi:iron complex outermembrane receptor protein
LNKPFVLKTSVAAVALALASTHAFAQQSDDAQVQKVYVTGSNIKRAVDSETSSPVQVISSEEIKTIGASTIKDVLDTLTSNTGALTDLGGGNSFASGATGVSLRNLGKTSTLTLLNGRRLSNYGLADNGRENFVNIDTIPADIIDRVEVLLDGASAVYGSDAVAGVVNIITKKEWQGTTVRAAGRQSLLNQKLDRDQTASITTGFGDLRNDGYNVFGHLEVFHRNPYSDRDVESTIPPWYLKYINPSFGVKSTYSYPGNYIVPGANGAPSTVVPVAGCATIESGSCRFDQWARVGIHAEAKRANFYGGGRLNLSGGRSLYSELSLSRTETTYYNAPPIMQYTGTPSTWYSSKQGKLMSFTEPKLPVGHPFNPYAFPVELRYRYADNPDMFKSVAKADQYRVLVGLEGTDFGWDWNTGIGAMGSKADNGMHGGKHAANYLDAVLTGKYKFGGSNSPELLNSMFPLITFGGQSKQIFADFKASRELMQLPGGPLGLAVGADLRRDSFDAWTSDNIANGEIVGYGSIGVSGSQNVSAAFAELNAPLTKKLEINAALRGDKVGQASAVVPKVGVRYEVTKSFMVRGTVANGFRAPNVAETGKVALSAFNNGVNDPKRCTTATQLYNILKASSDPLDQADALRARDSGCSVSFASAVQGNPDLQPEKSRSYTFGIVIEPFKNTSLTMDVYKIERRNEIGTRSSTQILANEDQEPGMVNRMPVTADDERLSARAKALSGQDIHFPVGPVTALFRQYMNLNKTRVSGIDMELNNRISLGSAGKLSTNVKANYQLDLRGWDTVTNTYTENLVGTYYNYRYTIRANTNWSRQDWKAGVTMTYVPETQLISSKYSTSWTDAGCKSRGIPADYCKLSQDFLVDFNTSYSGIKNTVLYMNMTNVFGRSQRIDMRSGDPAPRGRTLRLAMEYKF